MTQTQLVPEPQIWHFAVAYSLIRLKPASENLKDWLLSLRECLQTADEDCSSVEVADAGMRTSISMVTTPLYTLNEESFYRLKYKQAQFEIQKLQRKIVQQNAEVTELRNTTMNDASILVKRKAENTMDDHLNKKHQSSQTAILNDGSLDENHDVPNFASFHDAIATNLCLAQLSMYDEGVDPEDIVQFISRTIKNVKDAFADLFGVSHRAVLVHYFGNVASSPATDDFRPIESTLRFLRRTVHVVLLDILSEPLQRASKYETMALCIADLIDDMLAIIENHENCDNDLSRKEQSKSQGEGARKLCSWLVAFIQEILQELKIGNQCHLHLFEAITYLVFERAGRLLYILQFGHERSMNPQEEIVQDQEYSNTGEATSIMVVAQAQALFIMPLVQKIKEIAPYHYRPRVNSRQSKRHTTVPKRGTAKLSIDAKQKLEHTLISCIWNEQLDKCTEIIKRPDLKPANLMLPRPEKGAMHDSFAAQVWKLFAWDILGGKD